MLNGSYDIDVLFSNTRLPKRVGSWKQKFSHELKVFFFGTELQIFSLCRLLHMTKKRQAIRLTAGN